MTIFRLTNSLMTGHTQIDAEHEHLLKLLNCFVKFLRTGDDKQCATKINEITVALKDHLVNEEVIMEELGYWHFKEHKEEHSQILKKYEALVQNADHHGYDDNSTNDLISVFIDDIIKADMGFKAYLQNMDYRA